jgi:hypothetical protein
MGDVAEHITTLCYSRKINFIQSNRRSCKFHGAIPPEMPLHIIKDPEIK